MSTQPLSIGSDNIVSVESLRDTVTAAYINDATVGFVLYDSAGVAVSGGSGSMTYRASSDGCYDVTLQDTVVLTDANYYLLITAEKSSIKRAWRVPCQAKWTATD